MFGKGRHNLIFGWQADWAQGSYQRYADTYLYRTARPTAGASCLAGDEACIEGDQYLSARSVYTARNVKAGNNHFAAYIEDKINLGKWEFTPGLRIDHDRFLKNTDIAPRLTATYSAFDDKTRIFGGLNRYYADSMLAYKLREGIRSFYTETRSSPTADWTTGATGQAIGYRYPGNLKTPHSDEINFGIRQQFANSEVTLKWVQRHGKNQFAGELLGTGRDRYYQMNNNGRSSANTVTLSANTLRPMKFKYAEIFLSGGASYSRNKTNIASYDTELDDAEADTPVLMDGKLTSKNGIKATDYNNPWRVFANIDTVFPKLRLTWGQRFNYTAGYTAWSMDSNETCGPTIAGCGSYTGPVDIYTKERFKNNLQVDWRFTYDLTPKS